MPGQRGEHKDQGPPSSDNLKTPLALAANAAVARTLELETKKPEIAPKPSESTSDRIARQKFLKELGLTEGNEAPIGIGDAAWFHLTELARGLIGESRVEELRKRAGKDKEFLPTISPLAKSIVEDVERGNALWMKGEQLGKGRLGHGK